MEERFELISDAASAEAAAPVRLLLSFADVPFADSVLQDSAEFLATLRHVRTLPVLFDNVVAAEIGARVAQISHVASACKIGAGGSESDALRSVMASELVVSWVASGTHTLASAVTRLKTLQGVLSQYTTASPVITAGDVLAWLFASTVANKFGADVLETVPALRALYTALSNSDGVKRYLARFSAAAPPAAASAAPVAASSKGTVCVTGASGFIASWLVKLLLEQGYTVRGTVRSLAHKDSYEHLLSLPGAAARLTLHEASLLEQGSYKAAISGCTGVYHCASPFFFQTDNPERDLLEPAVRGTQNVLRECVASATVKRVVLTSSVASIYVSRKPADHTYTCKDWSDLEYIRETKQHYAESKYLAEREAWRIIREEQGGRVAAGLAPLTLATICPTQTIGPLLQSKMNQSSSGILELMDGSKKKIPAKTKCFVDVRDVASAHILAMQRTPKTSADEEERYLLISSVMAWRTVCDILRAAAPGSSVPTEVEAGPVPYPQALSSYKDTWDLGLRMRPIEDSLTDCAVSLADWLKSRKPVEA